MRDAQAAPPVECGDGSRPRRRGSGAGGHARGAVWLRLAARLSPRAPGRAVWPRGRPAPLPRVWGMHSASHRWLPERPSRGPVSAPPLPPPFPPDAPAGLGAAGTARILQARARSPDRLPRVTACGGRGRDPGPACGSKVLRVLLGAEPFVQMEQWGAAACAWGSRPLGDSHSGTRRACCHGQRKHRRGGLWRTLDGVDCPRGRCGPRVRGVEGQLWGGAELAQRPAGRALQLLGGERGHE